MTLMLTLLNNKCVPWLMLAICLGFAYLQIEKLNAQQQTLHNDNVQLQEDKQQLIEIIDYKNNEILDLSEQYSQHQQQLVDQKNQLQAVNRLNRQHQQQLERLKNENEQLRLWFNDTLPDDVKRLYTRPEIKGSQDYQQWLSGRDALLSTHE